MVGGVENLRWRLPAHLSLAPLIFQIGVGNVLTNKHRLMLLENQIPDSEAYPSKSSLRSIQAWSSFNRIGYLTLIVA